MQIIENPFLYPEINRHKRNIVLDTHVNLKYLLDQMCIEVRYNLMTRRQEIFIPGFTDSDDENILLSRIEYLATLNHFSSSKIDQHISLLAVKDSYHPIQECIKNNPWDGKERLNDFINTIKSPNPLAFEIIKTWLVMAIAAAYSEKGFTNHGVLILQGAQGIGKTEWVKKLNPIQSNAIKEGALLDPTNKDCIIGLSRYWIVEIGEMDATFKVADIARLKSFVTTQVDSVRFPYARRETLLPRRTAYIATVNEDNFLIDQTGNRRWWTIPVTEIDYQHNFNMPQVWSEVYHLWQQGALTYLSTELQNDLNISNKNHEKISPIEEKILFHYDWSSPDYSRWLSASQVLEEIGYSKPSQSELIQAGNILKKLNKVAPRKTNTVRLHKIPPRLIK